MLITKCDICKKEIKDRKHIVVAGTGNHFATNSFCLECGKPVVKFLSKVNKNKKDGKQKRK